MKREIENKERRMGNRHLGKLGNEAEIVKWETIIFSKVNCL